MVSELKNLLNNAYTPCSHFNVSCIAVMSDGNHIKGVNVELPSFISSMCAERNAIHTSFSLGYKKNDIKELHIMSNSNDFIYPCNVCRQSIVEFCDSDLKIFLYKNDGSVKEIKYNDIIINAYTKEDIIWNQDSFQ